MLHHPALHHQPMGAPQHIRSTGIPSHQQYQPPNQMARDTRIAMGHHNHPSSGMTMNGMHHRPHNMHPPPMQHHHGPPHHVHMRSIRRSYTPQPHYNQRIQSHHAPYSVENPVIISAQRPVLNKIHLQGSYTSDKTSNCEEHATSSENDRSTPECSAQSLNSVNTREKTAMCLVNELARFNKIKHQYRLTSERGLAHEKVFTVTLRLGEEGEYTAEGSSIKRAQHAAAAKALMSTQLRSPPPRPPHPPPHQRHHGTVMPTVELNAFAMKLCTPAVYSADPPIAPPYTPFAQVVHRVRVAVGGGWWRGEGASPQAARHDAAANALRDLRKQHPNLVGSAPGLRNEAVESTGSAASSEDIKSPVSLVHEIALKHNHSVIFSVKTERGPPHMRIFVTTCRVGDMECEGEGNGKKISKKRAAEAMLAAMKRRWPYALNSTNTKRKPTQVKRKPRKLLKEASTEHLECSSEKSTEENPISVLSAARHSARARSPQYRVLSESGAARKKEFVVECDATPHVATASGPNKKEAKRRAAKEVLVKMGLITQEKELGDTVLKTEEVQPQLNKEKTEENVVKDNVEKEPETLSNAGRQLVPGVLLMQDFNKSVPNIVTNGDSAEIINTNTFTGAKEQLVYLSKILGFTIHFSDFPKRNHGSYLTLVSVSTSPPVMAHGSGETLESSQEACATSALQVLAKMGLDTSKAE